VRIVVEATKCTGCKSCELICSLEHAGVFNPGKSRIRVIDFDYMGFSDPVLCAQCVHPACVEACPSGALTQTSAGTISVDETACNGCQLCAEACSHRAINFNAESDFPLICDLCDGKAKCVEWCPAGALTLSARTGAENDSEPRDAISRATPILKKRGIPDGSLEWYRKFSQYK
jgi:carbon-monoxide dehydrogenase iron sulfur subunit